MTSNKRVFGSSLASLVCVLEMSKKESITWIQSSPIIAGHFRGMRFGDIDVDLGMVVLETYSGVSSQTKLPLFPPIRQAGLDFVEIAHNWLISRGEVFCHIPIKTSWFGHLYPDYLIADNLTILTHLDPAIKLQILNELRSIAESGSEIEKFHPKNKNSSDLFLKVNLKDFIVKTLGFTFYQTLIEPWIERFDFEVAEKLPALDHRMAWTPLFYPETITEVLLGGLEPSSFERPFVVPRINSVASLIKRLLDSISDSDVQIIQDYTGDATPGPGDIILDSTKQTKFYLGEAVNDAQQNSKKVSVAILILKFDEVVTTDQVINFVDTGHGPYRALIRTLDVGKPQTVISLEFGSFYDVIPDEMILLEGKEALTNLGIPINFKEKILKRMKLSIPSAKERSTLEHERNSAFQLMQTRGLIGFPVDFGSSAFNDQILLGLWSENESRRNK